jgi:hypothetical protein
VKSGTSLSETCLGSGVPTPELRWKRGDFVLSVGNGVAELVLDTVTRVDIGYFVCEAFNGLSDNDVKTLQLDLLFAPEIELIQPEISFQPKVGMEVQCQVHSSSSPTVQWLHNDLLLQPKDGITMWSLDNLHVKRILAQFSCKEMSGMGEDDISIIITELYLEDRIVQELEAEERTNNVRRNVVNIMLRLLFLQMVLKLPIFFSFAFFCNKFVIIKSGKRKKSSVYFHKMADRKAIPTNDHGMLY